MIGIDFIKCVADLARDEEDRQDVTAIISPFNPHTPEWLDLIKRCKDECGKPWHGGGGHRDEGKNVLRWLAENNKILFPKDTGGEVPVIKNGIHWVNSESEIVWEKPAQTNRHQ